MQRHDSFSTTSSGQVRVECIVVVSVYTSPRRSEEALDDEVRIGPRSDQTERYQNRL
jgi:hypothetical protein